MEYSKIKKSLKKFGLNFNNKIVKAIEDIHNEDKVYSEITTRNVKEILKSATCFIIEDLVSTSDAKYCRLWLKTCHGVIPVTPNGLLTLMYGVNDLEELMQIMASPDINTREFVETLILNNLLPTTIPVVCRYLNQKYDESTGEIVLHGGNDLPSFMENLVTKGMLFPSNAEINIVPSNNKLMPDIKFYCHDDNNNEIVFSATCYIKDNIYSDTEDREAETEH